MSRTSYPFWLMALLTSKSTDGSNTMQNSASCPGARSISKVKKPFKNLKTLDGWTTPSIVPVTRSGVLPLLMQLGFCRPRPPPKQQQSLSSSSKPKLSLGTRSYGELLELCILHQSRSKKVGWARFHFPSARQGSRIAGNLVLLRQRFRKSRQHPRKRH